MLHLVVRWPAALALAVVPLAACPPSNRPPTEGEACDSLGEACPPPDLGGFARSCVLVDADSGKLQCVGVCGERSLSPGDTSVAGDLCAFDAECGDGTSCDNDVIGGAATCRCVAEATCTTGLRVGNTKEGDHPCLSASNSRRDVDDGAWSMSLTCRRLDGTCAGRDEDVGIGREYHDASSVCWEGEADTDDMIGQLCGSDFSFAESRHDGAYVGEHVTGVFHFSTETSYEAELSIYDRFGGQLVERCKGNGRTVDSGDPNPPPDCADYFPFGPLVEPLEARIFVARIDSQAGATPDPTRPIPLYDQLYLHAAGSGTDLATATFVWRSGGAVAVGSGAYGTAQGDAAPSWACTAAEQAQQRCMRFQPLATGPLTIELTVSEAARSDSVSLTVDVVDTGFTLLPDAVVSGQTFTATAVDSWLGLAVDGWSWEIRKLADDAPHPWTGATSSAGAGKAATFTAPDFDYFNAPWEGMGITLLLETSDGAEHRIERLFFDH